MNRRRRGIDKVGIHGMCAAPDGSIDGVYRSMFPKLFFGIFPYITERD
jgi:hypothetical protein